jgi:hypothetical protein
MPQTSKHLSPEHREEKKEKDGDFEVIRVRRADFRKIVKTAGKQDGAANHARDLEIRQTFVIEHSVKFQEPDHSEHANQQPKQDLVPGEHDDQRDCPKRDRADESQNEGGTRRNDVCPGLLKSRGHAFASFPINEPGASADEKLDKGEVYFPILLLS